MADTTPTLTVRERVSVATKKKTDAETLTRLSNDPEWSVRAKVARHTNTPSTTLAALSRDEELRVRTGVAANPNTVPEVLRRLASDEGREMRLSLAQNPALPLDLLLMLTTDRRWRVREELVLNPATPPSLLIVFVQDNSERVRQSLAHHSELPPAVTAQLTRDRNCEVRKTLARSSDSPDALAVLARDPDVWVRVYTSRNPNTDIEVVRMLANDEDIGVRTNAISYGRSVKNLTAETLHRAATMETIISGRSYHERKDLLQAIALHPDCSRETLDLVAADPADIVQRAVIEHANVSAAAVALLSHSQDPNVRMMAAYHELAAQEQLVRLLKDEHPLIRRASILNPNLIITLTVVTRADTTDLLARWEELTDGEREQAIDRMVEEEPRLAGIVGLPHEFFLAAAAKLRRGHSN